MGRRESESGGEEREEEEEEHELESNGNDKNNNSDIQLDHLGSRVDRWRGYDEIEERGEEKKRSARECNCRRWSCRKEGRDRDREEAEAR